jgi:hypothetical protein
MKHTQKLILIPYIPYVHIVLTYAYTIPFIPLYGAPPLRAAATALFKPGVKTPAKFVIILYVNHHHLMRIRVSNKFFF